MVAKPTITHWGIRVGTKVELEHTKSRVRAKKIAMDHLKEYGDAYYRGLIRLENQLAKKYGSRTGRMR